MQSNLFPADTGTANALDALRTPDHIADNGKRKFDPKEPDHDQRLDLYHITQRIERYVKKHAPWEVLKDQISTHLKNERKKA